jgi:hypothetical protein
MRRVFVRALALLAVGALPVSSGAQDRLAAMRRLRDAQISRYEAAKDSTARAEAAAQVVAGDTLTASAFRLFVPATDASLGQDLLAAAESALRNSWLRVPPFDTTVLSLSVDTIPGHFIRLPGAPSSVLKVTAGSGSSFERQLTGTHDHDSAEVGEMGFTLARLSYGRRMRSILPSDVLTWVGGLPPFDTVSADEWQMVSRRLRFSPSLPAQQCLDGDVRACRVVLGVDSLADPAHDAFDAEGRRVLVYYLLQRQRLSGAEAHDTSAMRRQCVDGRDDAACERFVRVHLVSQLGNFGGQLPRDSFLRFVAVHSPRNADSALAMLSNRGLGIAPRLEALGGAPFDRLVGEWQQHVAGGTEAAGGNGSSASVTTGSTWAAMLLTLLFCTMGVLGSRWR